jgi:hypothetical protein
MIWCCITGFLTFPKNTVRDCIPSKCRKLSTQVTLIVFQKNGVLNHTAMKTSRITIQISLGVNLLFPNRFTKLWKKKCYKHKYQQQLSFLRQRHNQQSCSVTDESLLWLALRFHNSQSRKKLSPVPTQGARVYMCVSVVSFHGSTM